MTSWGMVCAFLAGGFITETSVYNKDTTARAVAREAVSALLFPSRHPEIPIYALANIHWGYRFGVELVADFALEAYPFYIEYKLCDSGGIHVRA